MQQEHPFASYIRILGKGKRGSRSLSEEEAEQAMGMILDGEVEACQLGAFLMLLRVKEETPAEIAGFVRACRQRIQAPESLPEVILDWSSYAGKRRQLPWFILSVLLLVDEGISVFMHGTEGHTPGRVYTRACLEALGLPVADSLQTVARQLQEQGFSYLPLARLSPTLHEIIGLRPLLGLRSPIHTVARLLNPLGAPYQIQGIFHPGYRDTHQLAAQLLAQPHLAVFKGEGGEAERNPDNECLVKTLHQRDLQQETWPALFSRRHNKDVTMDIQRLRRVWRGEDEDEYAIASITATAAIALKLLEPAVSQEQALGKAQALWQSRRRDRLG